LLRTCKFLRPHFCRRHIAKAQGKDVLKSLQGTKLAPMLQHLKKEKKLLETSVEWTCYKLLPPDGRIIVATN